MSNLTRKQLIEAEQEEADKRYRAESLNELYSDCVTNLIECLMGIARDERAPVAVQQLARNAVATVDDRMRAWDKANPPKVDVRR